MWEGLRDQHHHGAIALSFHYWHTRTQASWKGFVQKILYIASYSVIESIDFKVPLVTLGAVSQQPNQVLVPHPPNRFHLNLELPLCLPPNKASIKILLNLATERESTRTNQHTSHATYISASKIDSFHTEHVNHKKMFSAEHDMIVSTTQVLSKNVTIYNCQHLHSSNA